MTVRRRRSEVESTRDRVLRVATEIFADKGFHGAGVAEIGEAAGLQRGALYYHIGSKDALLFEISKRHVEESIVSARAVLEAHTSAADALRALARDFLERVSKRHAEVVVWQREMHALSTGSQKKLNTLREEYERIWTDVMEQGVTQGEFVTADPLAVKGILGMLGYSYLWLRQEGDLSSDEVADRLMDVVLFGQLIRADRGSRRSHA